MCRGQSLSRLEPSPARSPESVEAAAAGGQRDPGGKGRPTGRTAPAREGDKCQSIAAATCSFW
eukprot:scaffold22740_cov129-Isochrysis_galbana.AAC.2